MSSLTEAGSGQRAERSTALRHWRRRRRIVVTAAVLTAFVAFGDVAVLWQPLGDQVLLSVTRRPTPFTEVFLSNNPPRARARRVGTSYAFSYVVHNASSERRRYRPDVRIRSGGQAQAIPQPVAVIGPGRTGIASVTFTPTEAARGSLLVVTVRVDRRTIRFSNQVR